MDNLVTGHRRVFHSLDEMNAGIGHDPDEPCEVCEARKAAAKANPGPDYYVVATGPTTFTLGTEPPEKE